MAKPYRGGVKLASGIAPNGEFYVADAQDIRYDDENSVAEVIDNLGERVESVEKNGGGQGDGTGSTVVVTPSLSSGAKVAEITVDGVKKIIYAPAQVVDTEFNPNSNNPVSNAYLTAMFQGANLALDGKAGKGECFTKVESDARYERKKTTEELSVVNSIAEMIDHTKRYVMGGWVYIAEATTTESAVVPKFTNILEGMVFEENTKLNVSNGAADAVTTGRGRTTDFIPVKKGDKIYMHNCVNLGSNGNVSNDGEAVVYYKADKSYLTGRPIGQRILNVDTVTPSGTSAMGDYYAKKLEGKTQWQVDYADFQGCASTLAYVRYTIVNAGRLSAITSFDSSAPIMTINEPIEYETVIGGTVYEWVKSYPYEQEGTDAVDYSSFNPFRGKKFNYHLNPETNAIVPAESLHDIHMAKAWGFNMIEANCMKFSDGVYLTKHGANGKIGACLVSDDGTDLTNVDPMTKTSDWMRQHVRYNTIDKYKTFVPTIEEFARECAYVGIGIKINKIDCLDICRKYLPDDMIWLTATARPEGFKGTMELVWRGTDVDEFVNSCASVGLPINAVVSSSTHVDTLPDELNAEFVQKCHRKGITTGIVYPTSGMVEKYAAMGFDTFGSVYGHMDLFPVGSHLNVTELNDSKIETTGTYDSTNDVLTIPSGGKLEINSDAFKCGMVSVRVRYNGTLTMYNKGRYANVMTLTSHVSDGSKEVCFALGLQPASNAYTNWIRFTADAQTTIYSLDVRGSVVSI